MRSKRTPIPGLVSLVSEYSRVQRTMPDRFDWLGDVGQLERDFDLGAHRTHQVRRDEEPAFRKVLGQA